MEKQIKNPREKKYRINVVLKDEVGRTNFNPKEKAKFKKEQLKELYPKAYQIGILEEEEKNGKLHRC